MKQRLILHVNKWRKNPNKQTHIASHGNVFLYMQNLAMAQ
jgi:hypothetical protein